MPFSRPPFSGFPFDRDAERDRNFQTELEDIAVRHPEFAEHLHPFHAGNSPRRTSGQDPFAEYRTFRDRPFGSRFEQFGFPFTGEFDEDPRFFRQTYQTPQQTQPQTSGSTDKVPEETPGGQKFQEKPPKGEDRGRKQSSQIHQSNTVDLGQKQEPVDDTRNQRSMSAPPENRNTTGKRFVSSINIPNLNVAPGDMGARTSQDSAPPSGGHPQPQQQQQQQQQPQGGGKPTERIIPIHIEGRDEPVVPKNVGATFAATQPPPQQQQQPQPEKIFGQRPSAFTQFLSRDEPQQAEEAQRKQQQEELMRQQYQSQQQEYQRQQQENFQKQQQQQQPEPEPPIPPQQTQKPSPLDLIQVIQKDVSKLMEQVEGFEGKPRDKQYLYLDEMLTRNLLKLDDIETEGKDAIRQARKEAIKCIEQCIQVLENKANANELREKSAVLVEAQPEVKMDVVAPEQDKPAAATGPEPEKRPAMAPEQNKPPQMEPETQTIEKEDAQPKERPESAKKPDGDVGPAETNEDTTTEKKKVKKKPEKK